MNPNYLKQELAWEVALRAEERAKWMIIILRLVSTIVPRTIRVGIKTRREMAWSPVDVWQGIVAQVRA